MFAFIYGTLALSLIGDRVFRHPIKARDTILHGFSKVYGWDYLTIVPSGSEVRGVVFEADDHDTSMMDHLGGHSCLRAHGD